MSICEDYHKKYINNDFPNENLSEDERKVLIETHLKAKKVYEKIREDAMKKYNPNVRYYIVNDMNNLI